ncbi:hypothetical protein BHM03_00046971, partial [Ensete ventricosum]
RAVHASEMLRSSQYKWDRVTVALLQVADMGDRATNRDGPRRMAVGAKETTKKAANFVAGRAADTKESIKDDANAVKRAMNAEENS